MRISAMLTRPSAFTASVAIHVAVLANGYLASKPGAERVGADSVIEFEISAPLSNPLAAAAPIEHWTVPPVPAGGLRASPHATRVAQAGFAGRKSRAPAIDVASANPAAEGSNLAQRAEPAASDAPPRFVIAAPTLSGARVVPAMGNAPALQAVPIAEAVLPEQQVSVPARLRSSAQLPYPAQARADEIEADVPLEIVVDARGKVLSARALTAVGHGFDEAALRAVRAYEFSPAQRDGRAVSVRMRWNVVFRLR